MRPEPEQQNPYAAPTTPRHDDAERMGNAGYVADCPACGGANADKISFTWWGGLIGPRLFSHVRCLNCNAAYNGKTGAYNTTGIVIYVTVGTVMGIVALWLTIAG